MARRWPIRPTARAAARRRTVDEADVGLLSTLDVAFDRAARRAGPYLLCRPGCAECCHGPFPITRLDVRRLRRGLAELRRADPTRADGICGRARRAVARLGEGFPGNSRTGRLTRDETQLDRFFELHAELPCPALDPIGQRCELHAWRPVACRTYGPPLAFGDESAPHCPLCFRDAPDGLLESCRLEPDPGGVEEVLLARVGAAGGEEWETLIAFALDDRE